MTVVPTVQQQVGVNGQNGINHRWAMWAVIGFLLVGVVVLSAVSYDRSDVIQDYKTHKATEAERLRRLELDLEAIRTQQAVSYSLLLKMAAKQGIEPSQ